MPGLPCLPAPRPPPFYLYKGDTLPGDAQSADVSKKDMLEDYLQKKSQGGLWQTRYFTLNNGYLVYYKDNKQVQLLGALDLSKVRAAAWRARASAERHGVRQWIAPGHCTPSPAQPLTRHPPSSPAPPPLNPCAVH